MIQNIIQELMKKMNLTEEQAKGGLGLLLKFCQEKLDPKNFAKITEMLDGWQELMKSAPEASAMMSKLSGIASVFGSKAAEYGSMANIAAGFKKLNIDISKIKPFVDTTLTYLKEKGGPQVKEMLDKFLKS